MLEHVDLPGLLVNTTRGLPEQGTALIRIDPNGHDTWRFNFHLDLQFMVDSHLGVQATNLQLSQNNQIRKYPYR